MVQSSGVTETDFFFPFCCSNSQSKIQELFKLPVISLCFGKNTVVTCLKVGF